MSGIPEFELWKVFVILGVPGLALGVFYMLLRHFKFDFPRVPRAWVGPIAVLFLLLTAGSLLYALTLWSPTSTASGGDESFGQQIELLNKQLRPVYFDLTQHGPLGQAAEETSFDPYRRRSGLDHEGTEKLKLYATLLKSVKFDYVLSIEGHTSRMAMSSNILLAETRIENVRDFLHEQGIPLERMKTVAYGGENWDGDNSAYSERVEFHIFLNGSD